MAAIIGARVKRDHGSSFLDFWVCFLVLFVISAISANTFPSGQRAYPS